MVRQGLDLLPERFGARRDRSRGRRLCIETAWFGPCEISCGNRLARAGVISLPPPSTSPGPSPMIRRMVSSSLAPSQCTCLPIMGDKAAGRHRRRVGGIEFRSRADPPRALQHDDVAVVGMEVRAAEMIALGPLVVDHVKAGFGRIAYDYSTLRAGGVDRAPGNLVRQFVGDRGRIELRGGRDAHHAGENQRCHEVSPGPDCHLHGLLRCRLVS